jgi:hypothetical protein
LLKQNNRLQTPTGSRAVSIVVLMLLGVVWSGPMQVLAEPTMQEAYQLLVNDKFKEAAQAYRALLNRDKTGDAYAGLAVALAKQHEAILLTEGEQILASARTRFAASSNLLAAGGYLSYEHSTFVKSLAKRDLYLQASEVLCRRALSLNPEQLLAKQTSPLVKNAQHEIELELAQEKLELDSKPLEPLLLEKDRQTSSPNILQILKEQRAP